MGLSAKTWVAFCLWTGCACTAVAFDPLDGDYSKDHALDVRIMAYNHAGNFITQSSRDASFNRIFIAINPDLICFEEFPSSVSQSTIATRLNSILPIPGGSWQIHLGLLGGTRNVLASRYPLTLTRTDTIPASSTRGVTLALANLPDADYDLDVYLLGVHLKCCGEAGGSEDAQRQDSADAIANWLGDARGVTRASGNNIVLPPGTPMIALGDFNLVGGPQPENTILTGNIQGEGEYGPDVKGDWDVTNLTNLNPLDPFTGDNFTWQGTGTFDPSPLDRMFYTDSAFTVANRFVLNTDTMTAPALVAAGLQAGDTLPGSTSDHLPIVMDLRLSQCIGNGECDDTVFCNGAETCSSGSCQTGAAPVLDDGIACTADSCDEASNSVMHTPDSGLCGNAQFCDGVEACSATLGCQPGTPPSLDDGVACTVDSCDENSDSVVHTPSDALCGNGQFCDGAETCSAALGCQAGASPVLNDGVACTEDSCDESNDRVVHAPSDAVCENGMFCDGAESCDALLGCRAGTGPCASAEWCDEAGAACIAHGDGDFDSDGDVDLADLAAFQRCFGQPAGQLCFAGNLVGDDGMIDLADHAALVEVLSGP